MEIKKNAAQSPVFTLEFKRVPVQTYQTELVSTQVAPAKPETYDLLGLTRDQMQMLVEMAYRTAPSDRIEWLFKTLHDFGFRPEPAPFNSKGRVRL